jgi:hypothetical protein
MDLFNHDYNITTNLDGSSNYSYKNSIVEEREYVVRNLEGSILLPTLHRRMLRAENITSNSTKFKNNSTSILTSIAPTPTIVYSSGNNINSQDNSRGSNEYLPFLLWYLLLVLCCILPTCFAYRRRRLLERRLTSQHNDRMDRIMSLQQQHQENNPINNNQLTDDAWNLLPYLYYQHQIRAQLQQQAEASASAITGGGGVVGTGVSSDEELLRMERTRIFQKELQSSSMVRVQTFSFLLFCYWCVFLRPRTFAY